MRMVSRSSAAQTASIPRLYRFGSCCRWTRNLAYATPSLRSVFSICSSAAVEVAAGLIEQFYPEAGRGRQTYPLETMLREHLMQNWFGLSDPGMEEALYEVASGSTLGWVWWPVNIRKALTLNTKTRSTHN
jgi:transposase-like protein DUF772